MSFLGAVGGLLTGGGFDALGSAAGGYYNYKAAKETNEMNYKMFKEQLEYDKPVNQVARLNEAGLNPNLIYGSGIQNTQTAGRQPTMQNPGKSALEGLSVGLLRSQLKKASAEADEAKSNALVAKSTAGFAPVMNTFAMLQNYENYYRSILNNERLKFDNKLLFQGTTPSFDRGVLSQGSRLLLNLYNKLEEAFERGVNNTSRPNLRGRRKNPTDGHFVDALSPAAFTPAGSWGFGSSY